MDSSHLFPIVLLIFVADLAVRLIVQAAVLVVHALSLCTDRFGARKIHPSDSLPEWHQVREGRGGRK